MKLNEAILFSRLRRHYDAVLYGTPSTALHLFPPELYLDHCDRLCADHVYLATVEHLPTGQPLKRACCWSALAKVPGWATTRSAPV